MSTVDPVEARRRREAARRESKPSAAMYVIGLLVIFVGGVCEVRSIYGFAEISGDADQPPFAIFLQIVGLPAILLGLFLAIGGARRYTGKLAAAPVVSPGTLLFAGFAAGAWWGRSVLEDPNIALAVTPVVLTALAALMLVAGTLKRLRRRTTRGLLAELVVSGRIVPGVITEIAEIDPSSGGLIGPVTVRFTDLAGVDRWVRKVGQWRRTDLPKAGDSAAVLFDPQDPGNTHRIWVGPAGSTTAQDFTLWHS